MNQNELNQTIKRIKSTDLNQTIKQIKSTDLNQKGKNQMIQTNQTNQNESN